MEGRRTSVTVAEVGTPNLLLPHVRGPQRLACQAVAVARSDEGMLSEGRGFLLSEVWGDI